MFNFYNNWVSLVVENKNWSSAHLIIIDNNGKVLLLKRSKTDEWMPGKFGLPGGTAEKEENLRDTVARECYEETKILLDSNKLLFLPSISNRFNHAFYIIKGVSNAAPSLDKEHDTFKWVNPKDLNQEEMVPDLSEVIKLAIQEIQ